MHGRTSTARDRACGSSNLLHRGAGEPRRRPSCRAGRVWTLRRACRPTTCRTRTSTSRAPRTWSCTGSDGCQTVVAGRVRYPVVLPAYDDALFHFLFSFLERKHILFHHSHINQSTLPPPSPATKTERRRPAPRHPPSASEHPRRAYVGQHRLPPGSNGAQDTCGRLEARSVADERLNAFEMSFVFVFMEAAKIIH